jgi:hypothetical protein
MATFILQEPALSEAMAGWSAGLALDMFGLQFSRLPRYAIVMHQGCICFAITFIQLFKAVRQNCLKNFNNRGTPVLIGDAELQ